MTLTQQQTHAAVTASRLPNGTHKLMRAGKPVGNAWRFSNCGGFGLRLNGVYWRNGVPNTRGGQTVHYGQTLREVVVAAEKALSGMQPAVRG